jgi:hypothetical protein
MVNFAVFRRTTLLRSQRPLAAVLLIIAVVAAASLDAQQNSAPPSSATPPVLDAEITSYNGYLLKPATAVRTPYGNDRETPLPPEAPTAKNPPNGAIIYYYLKSVPSNPLSLEIHDAQGKVVRRFNSLTPAVDSTPKSVPNVSLGPSTHLSKDAGLNRFVWDLRYEPPQVLNFSSSSVPSDHIEHAIPGHALPADTAREQTLGPLAVPGPYEVFFIGNGVVMKQPLTITLDPRVHVSQADLEAQLLALKRADSGLAASAKAFQSITNLRAAISDRLNTLGTTAANPQAEGSVDALNELDKKAAALLEGTLEAPGLVPINRDLTRTSFLIQSGDAAPNQTAQAALEHSCGQLNQNLTTWGDLDSQSVPATNTIIAKSGLAALPTATVMSITSASHDAASSDACGP